MVFGADSAVKGTPVLRIHNPNSDRTRLDELRRQLGRLEDERPAMVARVERARAALTGLESQTSAFQQGRIRQLESRIAALESDAGGAAARANEGAPPMNGCAPAEDPRGRERPPQEAAGLTDARQLDLQGCRRKKMVTPDAKRKAVAHACKVHAVS